MGVIVKRTVVLRAIVTDQLKQELDEELQRGIDEIDQRVRELDFRTQPYITDLQRTNIQQAMAIRKQVEAEKQRHQQLRNTLQERKQQLQELKDGDEVVRGTLESDVEVNEGDNLAELLGGVEILTKDEKVLEIRQRRIDEVEQEAASEIITDVSRVSDMGLDVSSQR